MFGPGPERSTKKGNVHSATRKRGRLSVVQLLGVNFASCCSCWPSQEADMTYIATLPQAQTPSLVNFDQRLGPIEYRRPASLKPYANNPRKHPEKQIVKLMASINQFGFALPVLVDGHGTIIAGQARVEAASRLGLAEIPVLVADKWTASEVRAYRLADNRLAELSSWDESTLLLSRLSSPKLSKLAM